MQIRDKVVEQYRNSKIVIININAAEKSCTVQQIDTEGPILLQELSVYASSAFFKDNILYCYGGYSEVKSDKVSEEAFKIDFEAEEIGELLTPTSFAEGFLVPTVSG